MATELIEPFERELRRNRRNDGFSADGLSYRVADDFGKLWGEALSEYETRTADPRFTPGAAQPTPDDPDLLRRQLLDPLMQRFGSTRQDVVRQATPRTYKAGTATAGEKILRVDPLTGITTELWSSPGSPPPPPKISDLQRSKIRQAERELAAASAAFYKIPNDDDRDNINARNEAVHRLRAIQQRYNDLVKEPESTALSEATPDPLELSPQPMMAIGAKNTPLTPLENQSDGLVAVINPNGKPTRIKASELERALKTGYKRR